MPNGEGPSPQERLPDPHNVLVEMTLVPRTGATVGAPPAPVPGAGRQFRILRTLEIDEYERPLTTSDILPLTAPRATPTDNKFAGTARKAAKLSIVDAPIEPFNDVNDLIATFKAHNKMVDMDISTDADSDRVDEE